MLSTILRSFARSILSRVSEGFSELAVSLGELNNKITVVENEYTTKFTKFDALETKLSRLVPDPVMTLSETELDQYIAGTVLEEAANFRL